jgi:hypothetical protein
LGIAAACYLYLQPLWSLAVHMVKSKKSVTILAATAKLSGQFLIF